jgi:hypothetical protein
VINRTRKIWIADMVVEAAPGQAAILRGAVRGMVPWIGALRVETGLGGDMGTQ